MMYTINKKEKGRSSKKRRSRVLNDEHYLTLSAKDGFKYPLSLYGSPSFLKDWSKEESILSVTKRYLFSVLCDKRP